MLNLFKQKRIEFKFKEENEVNQQETRLMTFCQFSLAVKQIRFFERKH